MCSCLKVQQVVILFCVLLHCCGATSRDGVSLNPGPENIYRKEGEASIFIPCPFYFGQYAPTWFINGAAYGNQALPHPYVAFPDGLLITTTSRELNGTTYQCYIEIGLEAFESSVGMLIIEFSDSVKPHVPTNEYVNTLLIMDYQRVVFTPENKTLTWAVINRNSMCSQEQLTYKIQAFTCPNKTTVKNWTSTDTMYTIPSTELANNVTYLRLSIQNSLDNSECGTLPNYLLIAPNVTTDTLHIDPNGSACIDIEHHTTDGRLSVLWPKNPTERDSFTQAADLDCVCPIFDLWPFESCHCIVNQSSTPYSVNFTNTTMETEPSTYRSYKLCWGNIDPFKQMNNTHIYFYTAKFICDGAISNDGVERLRFLKAVNIVINGQPPGPPTVTANGYTLEICSDDLDSEFQVKSYNVSFTDVTGEVPGKPIEVPRTDIKTMCTEFPNSVEDLLPEDCSPFDVSVIAKNDDGWSNATEKKKLIKNSQDENGCACMKAKVHFNMTIEIKVNEIKVKSKCSKMLAEANETMLTVELQKARPNSDEDNIVPQTSLKTIRCNDMTQLSHFTELQKETIYNISVYWNTSGCQISRSQNRTLSFPFSRWLTDGKMIGLCVGVPVSILLIGLFITIVVFFCCSKCPCCCYHNECKKMFMTC